MSDNKVTGHDSDTDQDFTINPDGDLVVTLDGEDVKVLSALVPSAFDYIALTYVAAGDGAGEVETATYKTGGSGGSTVATLTLTYDASDRVATVTRT